MDQIQKDTWPICRFDEKEAYLRVSFPPGTVIDLDILMDTIKACAESIRQHGKNDLWDLQNCSLDRDLNFLTLREAVMYITGEGYRQIRPGRTAVLVNSDFVYGVARTFQSIAEVKDIGYAVEIFQDEGQALAWLSGEEEVKRA